MRHGLTADRFIQAVFKKFLYHLAEFPATGKVGCLMAQSYRVEGLQLLPFASFAGALDIRINRSLEDLQKYLHFSFALRLDGSDSHIAAEPKKRSWFTKIQANALLTERILKAFLMAQKYT